MLHFIIHSTVLADSITIRFGNNAWTFSSNFIVYLIVGAVVGLVAEFLVGWRLPFGIFGAIIAGLKRIAPIVGSLAIMAKTVSPTRNVMLS